MAIGHGAKVKKRGVAVFGLYSLHFTRYRFQGFIPGNPGKFTRPSFSCPFKRVEQTVGSVNALAVCAAARTPAGPCSVIVIVFDSNDPIALDMNFQFAETAAVAVTNRAHDLFGFGPVWVHRFSILLAFVFLNRPIYHICSIMIIGRWAVS
jgi:hypothetical protein